MRLTRPNSGMDKQPSLTGLWRIGPVAKKLGVSVEVFRKACESGAIPVTVVSLGPRSTYVKVSEFEAWHAGLACGCVSSANRLCPESRSSTPATDEDLFS